ncbi:sodium-independent sulfate anion transporter-like isoform X2 [Bacillus rossius redtenbacheri]|uniref:sodium-independent sulfate anion transporter-like isoform X2 n=1 Tax=Bacillus rossius redtenbacheri TaxID=93214 RepID=UPI002FDCD6A6
MVRRRSSVRITQDDVMKQPSGVDNPGFQETQEAVANLYMTERYMRCPDTPTIGVLRRPALMRYGSTDDILAKMEEDRKLTKDRIRDVPAWFCRKARALFSRKTLNKRLPVLSWLPRYNAQDAVGDLVAGLTVGLTVIPQSLAYANIANLPAQYGLYSSFLGCFIYIVLGSCKDVPMGPTAIMSLLTYQTTKGRDPAYAILLCFLMGCAQVLMALLGLGFIIDFISGPVSSGFTSAAALIIFTSQVKDVLGIKASGTTFVDMWVSLGSNLGDTKLWDSVMGAGCIVVLLLMRMLTSVKIGPKEEENQTRFHRVVNKALWLIGTSRNAILVVIGGVIGFLTTQDTGSTLTIIGYIPAGLPSFQPPPFSHASDNSTASFLDMASSLGSGLLVLPLVGLLENIAVCKAFSTGKAVDATQELFALGISNIGNSFVQGFPGTGALSRSAVQNSSGSRTPLTGLYTGAVVILALLFFTPYFSYIPKACLAAIIIAAVIFMVEVHVVVPIWKTKKMDLLPGVGTFIACLVLPLEIGIVVGIAINILFILYHTARPKISIEMSYTNGGVEYLLLTPDRCLIFPSVDYMRNLVMKQSMRQNLPVVIDCSHIYSADYTAAKVTECLLYDFSIRKQALFFFNVKPSVLAVFKGLQPQGFVVFYVEEELDDLIKEYNKSLAETEQAQETTIAISSS